MTLSVLFLLVGIVGLYAGGELLVRGATQLAARFGISSMVIGLTVVAFGTSAPELAATLAASLDGLPGLALGNVIGSNIANIGLILGLASIAYPLVTERAFLRRELPIALGVALLLTLLALGGGVGRWEGALLVALLGVYLLVLLRSDEGVVGDALGDEADADAGSGAAASPWLALLMVAGGAALLVFGARALVTGASDIATALGVPERVIGLTMVAFGTSLPELAASLVAALRREGDIILGNVVGSNVFNVLAVLGVTSLVAPLPIAFAAVRIDLLVMIAFSLVLLPMVGNNNRVSRRSGAFLLIGYVVYITALYVF